jgi:hypothetical protein
MSKISKLIKSKRVIIKGTKEFPGARGSYVNVLGPGRTKQDGDPNNPKDLRWGITAILDPVINAQDIANINVAMAELTLDAQKFHLEPEKFPLHDGKKRNGKDGYEKHPPFLRCNNMKPAKVVGPRKGPDGQFTPITDPLDPRIYSGAYYCLVVNLWVYDHPTGGTGISASADVVQFVRDGEPFAHSASLDGLDEYEQSADELT